MAIGAGGLIGGLMFPGLDDQMARHITPNPNPLAQQGGPAQPGQVDSLGNPAPPPPGANLPPSASTQPDPVVAANTARLLDTSYASDALKYIRRNEMGQGINLGLDRIAAGFGTAEQQQAKQHAIAREQGVGGGLGDLAGIQKMQDQTIADNEHSRFMANAHIFGETLRGQGINVTDEQATEIMNGGKGMQEQFTLAAAGNATATGTIKDANAATEAWARANPNATKQQIEDYRASVISAASGGGNIEDQQYRAYAVAERAAGRVPDDILTWKAKHTEEATRLTTTAREEAVNKVDAEKDYPFMDQTLSKSEGIIKKLLANKKATIDAINTMPSRKEGWWAANTSWGASEEVRTQAGLLKELMSGLAGDNLKTVKNLRNRQEFQTLADSITARLQAGSTDESIESSLNDLLNKMGGSRSIAREQAGLPPLEKKEEAKGDGGSGAAPPQSAVDHLKAHPELADAFDAKFGAGAAKRALGQ